MILRIFLHFHKKFILYSEINTNSSSKAKYREKKRKKRAAYCVNALILNFECEHIFRVAFCHLIDPREWFEESFVMYAKALFDDDDNDDDSQLGR